jgi:hypothetical protein
MFFQWEERRRSRRLRGACGDFVKSQDAMPAQSLGGAHKSRVCVHVLDACMLVYVSDFDCTALKNIYLYVINSPVMVGG